MNKVPRLVNCGVELRPDHQRVITRFFVAGHEDVGPGASRANAVIDRLLSLTPEQVQTAVHDVDVRFGERHSGLHDTFEEHAARVCALYGVLPDLSPMQRRLLGASFTHEYSIEGAALCNPSAVLHPIQNIPGAARFMLSVRGIGEGHFSSIGFREGMVTADGQVSIQPARPDLQTGVTTAIGRSVSGLRELLERHLADKDTPGVSELSLDGIEHTDLELLIEQRLALAGITLNAHELASMMNVLGQSQYQVVFDPNSDVSERVLWPHLPLESHGMEDARFVRFVNDDSSVTFFGTYTGFDGNSVCQQLLQTDDFVTFQASSIRGPAAADKGFALFPRKINGNYAALSRADRETNSVSVSRDLTFWTDATPIHTPSLPWEIIQVGNCGSPIETDKGWLVLTHGVGPMRTYSLGAMLLDLDEPQRVISQTQVPVLTPSIEGRNGYVPNVVYSCGGFVYEGRLVVPYGVSDQTISVSTVDLDELLASLTESR